MLCNYQDIMKRLQLDFVSKELHFKNEDEYYVHGRNKIELMNYGNWEFIFSQV